MIDYFFIASLPMIDSETPPPMPLDVFVERCRERLPAPKLASIKALLNDRPSSNPFVTAWRDADTQIRNTLVHLRAGRLKQEPTDWTRPQRGSDLRLQEAVAAAFRQPDPWQREKALNALRHQLIDELQGPQAFGRHALLAYGLKLRLAWKRQRFDPEAGRTRLNQTVRSAELPDANDAEQPVTDTENGIPTP